jgi:thiol-disulfide isomerase/thioredoxin
MSKGRKPHARESQNQETDVFHHDIINKDRACVLFYATWCYFSQRFLPIFEKYAQLNPNECLSVIFDDKPNLCDEYAIEYYPTVILFKERTMDKRLDAKPGIGLSKKQLVEFTKDETS